MSTTPNTIGTRPSHQLANSTFSLLQVSLVLTYKINEKMHVFGVNVKIYC